MRAGHRNKWVSLMRWPADDDEARGEPLSPPNDWVSISPLPPGGTDDRAITSLMELRYRSDVTLDTRIDYENARTSRTHKYFVRGVQSVNESGDAMVLLVEDVQP